MSVLDLDGVTLQFGGLTAIDRVSFSVDRGEVVGLVGPNGAGKTSVLNTITGLYRPSLGRIRVGGIDTTTLPPHRIAQHGVQRTFQNIRLFDHLTVLENVMTTCLGARRLGFGTAREKARTVLADLGLADFIDLRPGILPYAVQRRVEIARAIAADPQVLLLDEPAAGMHGRDRDALVGLVREQSARGTAVIVIEHDMDLVARLCDRTIVMTHGRVLTSGSMAEIRRHPEVISAYLGVGA